MCWKNYASNTIVREKVDSILDIADDAETIGPAQLQVLYERRTILKRVTLEIVEGDKLN